MLDILYEDNHIIVVVKPQNIPTQEDSSGDLDMLTMVKQYIKEKYNKPGNVYVGLVHRLDRPTGGILVFAKTSKAAARLSEQIKDGQMSKSYFAVTTMGEMKNKDHLVHYLKKDIKNNIVRLAPSSVEGSKRCELNYNVLQTNGDLNLVDVELLTGRTHQIRVQMSAIKHPIYADVKYGCDTKYKGNLALWSYSLKFYHPTTKKLMSFRVSPPVDKTPWNLFSSANYNK